jgi:uncharacterized RDD family membrane protein YckC
MRTSETAVVFRAEDHLGVMKRLVIDIVDTALALVVSVALTIAALMVFNEDVSYLVALIVWPSIWFGYFVVLKASRFRTLGYVICGARIVSLSGERPTYLALAGRLAFAVFGPFNFLADLLWISSDPCRQALRDKVAHTYVVRKTAVPAGTGRMVYRVYTLFGMTLLFVEVQVTGLARPNY